MCLHIFHRFEHLAPHISNMRLVAGIYDASVQRVQYCNRSQQIRKGGNQGKAGVAGPDCAKQARTGESIGFTRQGRAALVEPAGHAVVRPTIVGHAGQRPAQQNSHDQLDRGF